MINFKKNIKKGNISKVWEDSSNMKKKCIFYNKKIIYNNIDRWNRSN